MVSCIDLNYGTHWINEMRRGEIHTYKINLGMLGLLLIPLPPYSEKKNVEKYK